MMKPKILRTDAELFMIEQYLDQIGQIAEVVTSEAYDEETLAGQAEDAEVILTCYTNITARVIGRAAKLRGIVKYGVGVDNIDLDAATRNNVAVANCPEYGSDTVADHAFALLIALARKIPLIDRTMRDRAWAWPAPELLGIDLAGKTIGLIGLGKIGRAMARRAGGFSMKRIAFDPYLDEAAFESHGAQSVSLGGLLGLSDFVSIHCVLTPETRGLLGEAELRKMKDTAYLIDVSRGAIVDEAALVRALDEGWIGGAGFDVFPGEPLAPGHPLMGRDNVILTPHLAWYTREAFERVERETRDRVLEILQGKRPKYLKNTELSG